MIEPLNIGLTGGIGSGKSTVAKVFSSFGIPCYYADTRAKELMNSDQELMNELIDAFGKELYKDGELNRKWLARKVFGDDEARKTVNGLVHPAVGRDFQSWKRSQQTPYVLREAAILFETGGYKQSDANILVVAPKELRLKRVMERDDASEEEVLSRMNAQWSDIQKTELADFIIFNDDEHHLIPQVKAIHETLLIRANSSN